MDHVSDSFLETNVPLLVLIEAAKNGNEKEVKDYAQVFREHANKLIEVGTVSSAPTSRSGTPETRASHARSERPRLGSAPLRTPTPVHPLFIEQHHFVSFLLTVQKEALRLRLLKACRFRGNRIL